MVTAEESLAVCQSFAASSILRAACSRRAQMVRDLGFCCTLRLRWWLTCRRSIVRQSTARLPTHAYSCARPLQ